MLVQCDICVHQCVLPEGITGRCQTKINRNGKIVDKSYGRITSAALDPIEKKPLKNFYPSSLIYSVGSYGCPLHCPFCQNWQISQKDLENQSVQVTPQMLVDKALELQQAGNIGICFTYNEPLIQKDMVLDTFKLAKEKGLKTVLVTAGSASQKTLDEVLPYTDAMNIDLKAFNHSFYRWVGGNLEATKEFIKKAATGCHVELTCLIIPGKNDSEREMEEMAAWIASISPDIPLHLTRYFPRYKCDIDMTPASTLHQLAAIARKHLNNVYLGNI